MEIRDLASIIIDKLLLQASKVMQQYRSKPSLSSQYWARVTGGGGGAAAVGGKMSDSAEQERESSAERATERVQLNINTVLHYILSVKMTVLCRKCPGLRPTIRRNSKC